MFGLSAAVRVYLAKQPADMRKSFDGLAALASGSLALDPLSGHLFVFVNKRRDRIKILYWDRDGLAVWAKTTRTRDLPHSGRCRRSRRDDHRRTRRPPGWHRPEHGPTPRPLLPARNSPSKFGE